MREDKIKLIHGGGGEAMEELLSELLPLVSKKNTLGGTGLKELDDSAVIRLEDRNLVFTTDSYTVKPMFFPGGDIGKLAFSGTINDLAVMGARPFAVSTAFIIGEGLLITDLKRIMESINSVSMETDTPVVTGDTKVVEEDIGLIINTSGIGIAERVIQDSGLEVGDKIIINGKVGDHGIAVLAKREGIEFKTKLRSDCAPLWSLVEDILCYEITTMKDPTRGGLANALNELAGKSKKGVLVYEERIPVRDGVRAASDMLGIDPLTVANEGKLVIGVRGEDAEDVLKELKRNKLGRDAEVIGEVVKGKSMVVLETVIGGKRILEKPLGDPIPRIC